MKNQSTAFKNPSISHPFDRRSRYALALLFFIVWLSGCTASNQPSPPLSSATPARLPVSPSPAMLAEPTTPATAASGATTAVTPAAPAAITTPASLQSPTLAPTQSPGADCSQIEHLPLVSPEAQQIVDSMIENFRQQQPTEYMGMAILQRVDRLGEWALIQGSVSGEAKDVIAVQRTARGYQIAEHFIITSPLESLSDQPETLVEQYFLKKLPAAPAALFTCLDSSWLLDRPGGTHMAGQTTSPRRMAYLANEGDQAVLYTTLSDRSEMVELLRRPMLLLDLSTSRDGQSIAFSGCPGSMSGECRPGTNLEILSIDWQGGELRNLTNAPGFDMHPDWSPDGRIVFSSDRSGHAQIYVMEADGSQLRQLTQQAGENSEPVWSPDGRWIAYHYMRGGETRICVISPDGQPAGKSIEGTEPVWSPVGPDGEVRLAFLCFVDNDNHLCLARPDGSGLVQLTDGPGTAHSPAWSPDGAWLAFISVTAVDIDMYKVCTTCPPGAEPVRLTDEMQPVSWPAWSPSGSQIAYVSAEDLMLVNPDRTGATYLLWGVSAPFIWQP